MDGRRHAAARSDEKNRNAVGRDDTDEQAGRVGHDAVGLDAFAAWSRRHDPDAMHLAGQPHGIERIDAARKEPMAQSGDADPWLVNQRRSS